MGVDTTHLSEETLYHQYRDKVYRYIRSRISHEQTAEDLLSLVFVKVIEKYDSYNNAKASISTWIYTITSNTLSDYFRRRASHGVSLSLEGLELEPATECDYTSGIIREETLEQLAQALEGLPEAERDLILLHYYYNVPLKTAAVRLGMGNSAAKYHHQMALERIRRHFSKCKYN